MNAPAIYAYGRTSGGVVRLALMAAWMAVSVVAWAQTNTLTTESATNAASVAIPQSVFVDEFQKGKDPFFPNSLRRQPVRPADVGVAIAPPPSSEFKLKGITGPINRRFALINNRDFEEGEKGSVYAGGKKVTIKCEKIGPRSVWITLEGQPGLKELRMPGE